MVLFDEISDYLDVSRETTDKLKIFIQCLEKWQNVTRLIAPGDFQEIWKRHILDSLQLCNLIDVQSKHILDFGSGGGFPGMILAIMGFGKNLKIHLVESNSRKAEFLRYVSRETGVNVAILNKRFENVSIDEIGVPQFITARAVASLPVLIGWSEKFLKAGSVALFHKGKSYMDEIGEAQLSYKFQYHLHKSITDPDAVIVEIAM